jgi:ribosomal protein S18 acetylase RimI-like enzyme
MAGEGRPAIRVRAAAVADARSIAGIRARSWKHAYAGLLPDELIASRNSREFVSEMIEAISASEPRRTFLVAEAGRGTIRKVAGFAVLGPATSVSAAGIAAPPDAVGQVYMIYVDPRWARRGVGRALNDAIVAAAAHTGFDTLALWVLPANANARAFYDALGWTCDGAEQTEEMNGFAVPEVRYVRDA